MNNNEYIINIRNNDILEKYLIDYNKLKIFKLNNLNNHSDFFIKDNFLIINTALYGNQFFEKNLETNIFEKYILLN